MRFRGIVSTAAVLAVTASLLCAAGAWAGGANSSFAVVPQQFDPDHSSEVTARWVQGLGVAPDLIGSTNNLTDTNDPQNDGLLLGADGLSSAGKNGAGLAHLVGINNVLLSTVGYDLRAGSNCGGGNPRFFITITNGCYYFIACNYPPPTTTTPLYGSWTRYSWDPQNDPPAQATSPSGATCSNFNDSSDQVSSMYIVFDAGSDGFAVLDNIQVNGVLVGH